MDSGKTTLGLGLIIGVCVIAVILRCLLLLWQIRRPFKRGTRAQDPVFFYHLGAMELFSYHVQPHLYQTNSERYSPYPKPKQQAYIQSLPESSRPLLEDVSDEENEKSVILDMYEPQYEIEYKRVKTMGGNVGEPVDEAEESLESKDPPVIETTQYK